MADDLIIQRRDGGMFALTDPDETVWSVDLLDNADPEVLSVNDGVVTLNLTDETRRYRLGPPRESHGMRVVPATRLRQTSEEATDAPDERESTTSERDERTGAPMLDRERVQIFTVDGSRNALGQFLWGWQCFECGDEETAWRNASTARVAAENHEATCLSAPVSAGEPRGDE